MPQKGQRTAGTRHREAAQTGKAGAALLGSLPMLRTSERGAYKRCEFLWNLTYNQRLKPMSTMPALRFGALVHKSLAAWYIPGVKRGKHPAEAFDEFYAEDMRKNDEIFGSYSEDDERWVNAHEMGVAMLENYISEYGGDDDWEVIATEYPFETLVYKPWTYDPNHPPEAQATAEPWFHYVGVLDGIWRRRSDKTLWVPDHKTTGGIGPKTTRYLRLDDQAGSYWSYGVRAIVEAELMRKNEKLNGMLYNFLRKALPDERASKIVGGKRVYLNNNGSVSQKQPSPYFLRAPIYRDEFDRAEAMRRAEVDFQRMESLRTGEFELSKNPGPFTCPGCPVLDACELHETGNDYQGFIDQTMEPWDPYSEHEIYAGR